MDLIKTLELSSLILLRKQTDLIFKPHDKKNNFYEPCKLEESIKAQQIKRFLVVT